MRAKKAKKLRTEEHPHPGRKGGGNPNYWKEKRSADDTESTTPDTDGSSATQPTR